MLTWEFHTKGSDCVGANHLIELLKNYSRNAKMKQALTVGIVGYPNVGKSSLINSLKRSKAVGVGSTPGFTSVMQEVHLDKKIRLLDCPGIVFSSKETTDSGLVLRNCVKLEQLADPLAPVEVILRRCRSEHLMRLYAIPAYEDSTEFLEEVAKRRGKFSKGVPDYRAAARIVLQDWNSGRIPFFTIPPEELPGMAKHTAQIVSQWSKEFDLDTVTDFEAAAIEALPDVDPSDVTAVVGGVVIVCDSLARCECASVVSLALCVVCLWHYRCGASCLMCVIVSCYSPVG
jgi:nuclear GTP-binding protein